jgi:hypothetical protein
MNEAEIHRLLLMLCFVLAGAAFFATGIMSAPYGRHVRAGWGPELPKRLGWTLMETPSLVVFTYVFSLGSHAGDFVPRVFAAMWIIHYLQRAWIDPFLMRGTAGKTMPVVVTLSGASFNVLNAYLNARWLSELGPGYTLGWLIDLRFIYGMMLFVGGFLVNRWADFELRRLRREGGSGYQIPRAGLFTDISCPNYFGELVQWIGWAIATWSMAGLSFAVFTAANLIPRAVSHHRWYIETFPDYPRGRSAIFPRVL